MKRNCRQEEADQTATPPAGAPPTGRLPYMAGWAAPPSHCLVLPSRTVNQLEGGIRCLNQSEASLRSHSHPEVGSRSLSQSEGCILSDTRSTGQPDVECQYGGQAGPTHLVQGRKSSSNEKENEDSSAVVSSTQDEEKLPPRYNQMQGGEVQRHYAEEGHRKQDHFGSIISMLNEIQDATNCDIEQILAEGNFQQEIKTENPMEMEMGGGELAYLANQDLYPTSYLRQQTCAVSEEVYRYSPVTSPGAECESPASSLQYSTHLHHSPSSHNIKDYSSPSPQMKSPYSPSSPGSGSKERTKDEKYWERRRKNNLAAKKSRDARRVRENQLRLRVLCLENANRVLRTQLDRSHDDNLLLRERLKKYEGESCLAYSTEKPAEYSMSAGEADYEVRVGETDYSLRGSAVNSNNYRLSEKPACDPMHDSRQLTALA